MAISKPIQHEWPRMWAVRCTRSDGTNYLAVDHHGPVALFFQREYAVEHARELLESMGRHGMREALPVRVSVTIHQTSNPNRRGMVALRETTRKGP